MNIESIKKLHRQCKYDEAMLLTEQYIECFPKILQGYREKAHILLMQKNEQDSLAIRELIVAMGSQQPCDYYHLAVSCMDLGINDKTIEWANRGIELSLQNEYFYYFESCYFHKAAALVNLCRFEEALIACSYLEKDFSTWVNAKGMVSKEDLEQQCHANLSQKKKRQTSWQFDED